MEIKWQECIPTGELDHEGKARRELEMGRRQNLVELVVLASPGVQLQ